LAERGSAKVPPDTEEIHGERAWASTVGRLVLSRL